MNRQTEDRLRAAFDAKAEQVTDERLDRLARQRQRALTDGVDDTGWNLIDGVAGVSLFQDRADAGDGAGDDADDELTALDIDHQSAGARHGRWLAPVLAAAAVVAVAVGVTAISTVSDDGGRTTNPPATRISTPTPSVTPTPSSSPSASQPSGDGSSQPSATATAPTQVQLEHGQQAGRSQIPWSQVGPGWTLALWTPSTKIDPSDGFFHPPVLRTAAENLFLVNPVGGRYLITTFPVKSELTLIDWSGDGRRALFHGPGTSNELSVLDLQNGTVNKLPRSGGAETQFTRPLGKAVLLRNADSYERIDLDGATQLKFPGAFQGWTTQGKPLYTEDGSRFVVATEGKAKSDARLMVIGNDGRFIRALPGPVGYGYCSPRRWWTAEVVLAFCQPAGGVIARIFLMPLSGEPATALAAPRQDTHLFDAVKVGSSTLLQRGSIHAECGEDDLVRLLQNGTGTDLNLAAAFGGTSSRLLGAAQNRVQFEVRSGCVRGAALVSHDPATGESKVLLGGWVNGGSILDALTYRATDPAQ